MENKNYTVAYLVEKDTYEILNDSGEVESVRVTPGGAIADLMDLGLSQEDATAKVLESGSMGR